MKTNTPFKVQRFYEPGFKIAVARDYLEGKLGYGKIACKYQIPRATVCTFVQWYKKTYPEHALSDTSLLPVVSTVDAKSLSKALELAQLKIASLEMMIEKAKKELDIDIVKKYGTKQP